MAFDTSPVEHNLEGICLGVGNTTGVMDRKRGSKTKEKIASQTTHAQHSSPVSYKSVNASTWFQLLLYYNICASTIYFLIEGYLLIYRLQSFEYRNPLVVLLNVLMFVLWTVGEIFRLYVGFVGNVQEQVPQLAAFLLVVCILTTPSLLWLTFGQQIENALPFDLIGGYVQMLFVVVEVIFNVQALRRTIDFQTAKFFRLTQLENDDQKLD